MFCLLDSRKGEKVPKKFKRSGSIIYKKISEKELHDFARLEVELFIHLLFAQIRHGNKRLLFSIGKVNCHYSAYCSQRRVPVYASNRPTKKPRDQYLVAFLSLFRLIRPSLNRTILNAALLLLLFCSSALLLFCSSAKSACQILIFPLVLSSARQQLSVRRQGSRLPNPTETGRIGKLHPPDP